MTSDMKRLLTAAGYAPDHAQQLLAEGMGPLELAERLAISSGVGSLEYTHGFARIPMAVTSDRRHPYPAALRDRPCFVDTSWGNDVTESVSFALADRAATVWVEHPDPALRSEEWAGDRKPGDSPRDDFAGCHLDAPARYMLCASEGPRNLTPDAYHDHLPTSDVVLHSTEDPSDLLRFISTYERDAHAAAAGALCREDTHGCCSTCGVDMSHCNVCQGIGYHRELCPADKET